MTTTVSVACPRCKCTQVQAVQKGFGAGKAAAGAVLLGPAGLAAGFIGSGKTKVMCLRCGFKWTPAPPMSAANLATLIIGLALGTIVWMVLTSMGSFWEGVLWGFVVVLIVSFVGALMPAKLWGKIIS